MAKAKWEDLEVGKVGPEDEYGPLSRIELVDYANAGGDTNPIHQDYVAAVRAGNKGIISHGLYIHAKLGKMLVDWVGDENVRAYNGRMIGMTRPGDTIYFKGIVTKKYEEDGKKLVDMDVKAITKTYYVRGAASVKDDSLSEEDILKNLANGKLTVNIDWKIGGERKFNVNFEADGIEINPKRFTGDEALIRDWFREGKDALTAEFIKEPRKGKFWFAIVRYRDAISGTATCVIPE
jgi:acyl dehydratase